MCASTPTFLPSFSLLSSFSPSFSLSFFYSTVLCPSTFSYNISLSLFPHVVIRNYDPLPFFRLCLFLSFPMKSTEERPPEQLPLRMYIHTALTGTRVTVVSQLTRTRHVVIQQAHNVRSVLVYTGCPVFCLFL